MEENKVGFAEQQLRLWAAVRRSLGGIADTRLCV